MGLVIAALLPFGRSIQFAVFLLPCLDVFTQTPYISMSLATLIFLAMFGRYLLTQLFQTSFYRAGMMITLLVVIYELLHMVYNPVMVSTQTVRWLLLFVFASLLIFDRNKYIEFKQLRFALLLGVIVSTGYGVLHKFFFPVELYHVNAIARFAGAAGDPNNFGLYCLLVMYFYLPTIPRVKIPKSSFLVVMLMLSFGALTVSRSFFLVSILSLLLYFVLYYRSAMGDIAFRLLLAVNIVLITLVVFFFSDQAVDMNLAIFSRFSGDNLSELTGARSDILREYIALFLSLPMYFVLFGAGINGYLGYYNFHFSQRGLFPEVVGPHNTFLEIFISFGFIGCLVLFTYVYSAFKAEKTRTNNHQVFRLALIPLMVFLLYCFSLQNLGKYSSYFILLLIIYNTYRKEA